MKSDFLSNDNVSARMVPPLITDFTVTALKSDERGMKRGGADGL
jgi:hypothetical protein